jgi:hypothetical protein
MNCGYPAALRITKKYRQAIRNHHGAGKAGFAGVGTVGTSTGRRINADLRHGNAMDLVEENWSCCNCVGQCRAVLQDGILRITDVQPEVKTFIGTG